MGEPAATDATTSGSPKRLVAIRPGALGDALLTLPALAWLRRQMPGSHSTLVTRRDVLSLARDLGVADAAVAYDDPAWSVLFAEEPPPRRGLAHDICAGARVVAWTGADDGTARRNLLALGAAAAVVAPGKPQSSTRRHMALQLGDALHRLGFPMPSTLDELMRAVPSLRPSNMCQATIDRWLHDHGAQAARLIGVHPGSGGVVKRWPARSFAGLVERIQATGHTPVLIEGPQDAEVVGQIQAARPSREDALLVARDLTVETLAAMLRRCAAFAGNDSGVTHLAALVGCPTVAIFGPTDPAVWRPLGRRVSVVRARSGRTEDVRVEVAASALRRLLGEQ